MESSSRVVVRRQYGAGNRKAQRSQGIISASSASSESSARKSPRRHTSTSQTIGSSGSSSPPLTPASSLKYSRAKSSLSSSSASEWSDVLNDRDHHPVASPMYRDLSQNSSSTNQTETEGLADEHHYHLTQRRSPRKLDGRFRSRLSTESPPTSSPPPPSHQATARRSALTPIGLNVTQSTVPKSSCLPVFSSPTKSKGLQAYFRKVEPPSKRRKLDEEVNDSQDELSLRYLPNPRTSMSLSGKSQSLNPARGSLKRDRLEQLYLDPFDTIGHSTLSCATCSMSFARTPEDMALHKKHHKKVVGGIDYALQKPDEETKGVTVVDDALEWGQAKNTGGKILMVEGSCLKGSLGKKITEVMSTVDMELSSSTLTSEQLSQSKVFLFVTPQRKVIACAVIQRIKTAYAVVQSGKPIDKNENENKPSDANLGRSDDLLRFGESEGAVFCSSNALPTLLGVHRIWTCSSYRREGLASQLLDIAAERFIYGCPISRKKRADNVAFSQPTGAGMELARRWTETSEFRVFAD